MAFWNRPKLDLLAYQRSRGEGDSQALAALNAMIGRVAADTRKKFKLTAEERRGLGLSQNITTFSKESLLATLEGIKSSYSRKAHQPTLSGPEIPAIVRNDARNGTRQDGPAAAFGAFFDTVVGQSRQSGGEVANETHITEILAGIKAKVAAENGAPLEDIVRGIRSQLGTEPAQANFTPPELPEKSPAQEAVVDAEVKTEAGNVGSPAVEILETVAPKTSVAASGVRVSNPMLARMARDAAARSVARAFDFTPEQLEQQRAHVQLHGVEGKENIVLPNVKQKTFHSGPNFFVEPWKEEHVSAAPVAAQDKADQAKNTVADGLPQALANFEVAVETVEDLAATTQAGKFSGDPRDILNRLDVALPVLERAGIEVMGYDTNGRTLHMGVEIVLSKIHEPVKQACDTLKHLQQVKDTAEQAQAQLEAARQRRAEKRAAIGGMHAEFKKIAGDVAMQVSRLAGTGLKRSDADGLKNAEKAARVRLLEIKDNLVHAKTTLAQLDKEIGDHVNALKDACAAYDEVFAEPFKAPALEAAPAKVAGEAAPAMAEAAVATPEADNNKVVTFVAREPRSNVARETSGEVVQLANYAAPRARPVAGGAQHVKASTANVPPAPAPASEVQQSLDRMAAVLAYLEKMKGTINLDDRDGNGIPDVLETAELAGMTAELRVLMAELEAEFASVDGLDVGKEVVASVETHMAAAQESSR